MSETSIEERISAYLDGEVNEPQRAEMERLLAEDPRARQLYDDMKAMGTSLRSLPREKLEHDLAAAVLARAEREMLLSNRVAKPSVASDATVPLSRRLLRPVVYAVVTIAAAVMVMVFTNREPEKRSAPRLERGPSVALQDTAPPSPAEAASLRSRPLDKAAGRTAAAKIGSTEASEAAHEAAERMPPVSPEDAVAAPADKPANRKVDGRILGFTPAIPNESWTAKNRVLIVQANATPEAMRDANLAKVFKSQGIAWPTESEAVDANAKTSEPGQESEADFDRADQAKLIFVEATSAQIEGALSALNARPKEFPAVEVDPEAANSTQQAWPAQYNRNVADVQEFRGRFANAGKAASRQGTRQSRDRQRRELRVLLGRVLTTPAQESMARNKPGGQKYAAADTKSADRRPGAAEKAAKKDDANVSINQFRSQAIRLNTDLSSIARLAGGARTGGESARRPASSSLANGVASQPTARETAPRLELKRREPPSAEKSHAVAQTPRPSKRAKSGQAIQHDRLERALFVFMPEVPQDDALSDQPKPDTEKSPSSGSP